MLGLKVLAPHADDGVQVPPSAVASVGDTKGWFVDDERGLNFMNDVGDEILGFVRSELSDGSFLVDAETDLLQEEIIDSLGVFTLIGFLEQRFGVKIDASEVDLDNFRTVSAVERLVVRSR